MIVYSNSYLFQQPVVAIGNIQTPLEYYNDEASHGSYQYITLKHIIDNMLLKMTDDDHYLKNTKRSLLLQAAKRGIKKLNRLSKDVFSIELTVGDDLCLTVPQDFVNWVRISVVDEHRKLQVLNVNRNINLAIGYLQDNNAQILFDNDGKILTADSNNAYAFPYQKYEFCDDYLGGYAELDTSKLSRYGEVTLDERRGKFVFSSNLRDKEVVIEYQSDGLHWEDLLEEEITIHKNIEEALLEWIYYDCIQYKRNVPSNEKRRALDRYKTVLHQAKIIQMDFNIVEVSRLSATGKML